MAKQIYEVVGTYTVNVYKRVKAKDEYDAIEKAEELFKDLSTEYNGNSVFVTGESEEVSAEGYVEWQEAYVTDKEDYDEESDYDDDEDEEEDDDE